MSTFIENARRAQIIEAAIDTLAEWGYANTSLAKVAQRIKISTALISYHFKDKADLMDQVINDVMTRAYKDIAEHIVAAPDEEKLQVYIKANIIQMGTRPKYFKAVLEIIMGARDENGAMRYPIQDDEAILAPLEMILAAGQEQGYYRDFAVRPMAIAIRGVIDNVLVHEPYYSDISLEQLAAEAADLFYRATKKEEK